MEPEQLDSQEDRQRSEQAKYIILSSIEPPRATNKRVFAQVFECWHIASEWTTPRRNLYLLSLLRHFQRSFQTYIFLRLSYKVNRISVRKIQRITAYSSIHQSKENSKGEWKPRSKLTINLRKVQNRRTRREVTDPRRPAMEIEEIGPSFKKGREKS